MSLRGSIDVLTHRRIVGWAYESDEPNGLLWLMAAIGSRVLGRCRADKFREDLAIDGLPGWHGFELSLPAKLLSPRQAYEISVRREGDGAHLPSSPYVLEPGVRIVRET